MLDEFDSQERRTRQQMRLLAGRGRIRFCVDIEQCCQRTGTRARRLAPGFEVAEQEYLARLIAA